MRRLLLLGLIAAAPATAATAGPDWPCMQRLVPTLTAATLWSGPAPEQDWRADPAIAALVDQTASRSTKLDDAVERLQRFVATDPAIERRAEVFTGLVERSNAERTQAIDRLRGIARRLHALAEAVGTITSELNDLPADTPLSARADMASRRSLMIREYEDLGRTVRYACEIPVAFETRLGRFGQILGP